MRGKTQAEIIHEAYRLMSERQGRLKNVIDANDFKAGSSLENKDIGAAKNELMGDVGGVTPTFPEAVQSYAEGSRPIDQYKSGYDALRRSLGKPVAGKNLGLKTEAAFTEKTVPKMTPADAVDAGRGILGAVRETAGPMHPVQSIPSLLKATKLLRATDARSGLPQTGLRIARAGAGAIGSNQTDDVRDLFSSALDALLGTESRQPQGTP
jgi:hypothetical protein